MAEQESNINNADDITVELNPNLNSVNNNINVSNLSDGDFSNPTPKIVDLNNSIPNPDALLDAEGNPTGNLEPDVLLDAEGNPTVKPNTGEDNKENEDPTGEDNTETFDEYSKAALFSKLLMDSGMPIFAEEVPKDLDPLKFVESVKKYNESTVTQIVNNKLEALGRDAEYLKMKQAGIDLNTLTPALQAEKYAQFDLTDPKLTDDKLEEVVRAMYNKQVSDPDTIDGLIALDKQNNVLKDKATKSVEFHDNYIKHIKNLAITKHQDEIAKQNLEQKAYTDDFIENLRNTEEIDGVKVTDELRAQIYDNQFKKDQPIKYVNDEGLEQIEYVTKHDAMMYELVNNPKKLIKLHYLLMNDFSLEDINTNANRKITQALLSAIEGGKPSSTVSKKGTSITHNNNDPNNNNDNSGQILMEF